MTKERNALAELAEQLNNGYVSLVVNGRQMATFATTAFPELDKATRIIAELAKVPDCTFEGNPRVDKSADAVIACRAIAESN